MDRRSFVAGVGAGSLATVAGCLGRLDDGSGSSDGSSPATGRWAIAPESPTRHTTYFFQELSPRAVLDASDDVGMADLEMMAPPESVLWERLDVAALDRYVYVQPTLSPILRYAVYEGSFDSDRPVTAISDGNDAEHLGSYRDYELHGAGRDLYAVDDGTAIEIRRMGATVADRTLIEGVVDAGGGRSDRLADVHGGAGAILDRLGREHWSFLRIRDPSNAGDLALGDFEGVEATCFSATVDDGRSTERRSLAFTDEAAREAAPVERFLERLRSEDGVQSVEAQPDGRLFDVQVTTDDSTPFDVV